MNPGKLDLPIIWRGCDWPVITLRWKDLNGNPFDLTGWAPYASTSKQSLNARIIDVAGGITTLTLDREQTLAFRQGTEAWTWLWTHVSTQQVVPPTLEGSVTIKQPIKNVPAEIITPPPSVTPSNGQHDT